MRKIKTNNDLPLQARLDWTDLSGFDHTRAPYLAVQFPLWFFIAKVAPAAIHLYPDFVSLVIFAAHNIDCT